MKIIEITEYRNDVLVALNALLPQLSESVKPITEPDLKEIISAPATHLLLATENNITYGCLTLIVSKTPSATRAWIEDVIVSKESRGKGIGRLLTRSAIDIAKQLGADTIDLTSRPAREAANALYKKAGFKQRETNSYRYTVG